MCEWFCRSYYRLCNQFSGNDAPKMSHGILHNGVNDDRINTEVTNMDSMQPKKLLIINILDILKKYTDEDHRLSQKEIAEILETEYDMKADRKAIKRNLMNLIEFGYEIEYSEALRMVKNSKGELEESYILSDFYLVRDFTDAELRLLIDSLLFSKHIPYSQCKELIEKIEGLSNKYFRNKVKHIRNLPENMPQNKELFYTIEVLDEAIGKGRQVAFRYNDMGTDKKQHPRKNSEGAMSTGATKHLSKFLTFIRVDSRVCIVQIKLPKKNTRINANQKFTTKKGVVASVLIAPSLVKQCYRIAL